ncbi:hypothetical protein QVG61_00910 [Thiohalobacter sp. IOR34]|uniref:hypothetical protein n=1 Tax=Thiohalobacter sp. IOR34 TaxID=3057176 RepID=UPI0025B27C84|nr:hypothetical protein [Thiohalobacter sp. IOR34]WJW75676.1 hypothetical protein QVG61_00910 [Thiohalobacter sp. IOR34]
MRTSLLLGLLLLCLPAIARDINGNYAVLGVGGASCATYLEARDAGGEAERAFIEWTAGHLSAYNLLLASTYNILGELDAFGLLARLDSRCRQAREDSFIKALARELEILYETRANLAPEQSSGWYRWLEDMSGGGKRPAKP